LRDEWCFVPSSGTALAPEAVSSLAFRDVPDPTDQETSPSEERNSKLRFAAALASPA